jgi:hypothetical protein
MLILSEIIAAAKARFSSEISPSCPKIPRQVQNAAPARQAWFFAPSFQELLGLLRWLLVCSVVRRAGGAAEEVAGQAPA